MAFTDNARDGASCDARGGASGGIGGGDADGGGGAGGGGNGGGSAQSFRRPRHKKFENTCTCTCTCDPNTDETWPLNTRPEFRRPSLRVGVCRVGPNARERETPLTT